MTTTNVPRLLVQRVKLWQRRTLLTSWEIAVVFAPIKTSHANTSWADHTQNATMTFDSVRYPSWTDEFMNHIILHEHYHLLTARVDDTLGDYVGRGGAVYKAFSKADETAADAFATAFTNAYKRKRD